MRKLRISLGAVAVAVVLSVGALARADALSGTWAITVSSEDGGKSYADTLTFGPTTLTSEQLKKQGFDPAAYESDARGGQSVTFTCTQKSAKAGEAKWTGTAAAGQLTGTLAVTKPDGSTTSYTYKGERVKK